ncbi:MAG: DNA alkylation repair protein [Candidatus Pacebacteria bacterium]|nr:DNA alkylation repair protein [Candidatus Paceibacterota bacterium]
MFLNLQKELEKKADSKKAKILQRFFKTNPGEYGQGDIFLGIKVPEIRKTIKKYSLSLQEIEKLLHSKFHEQRLAALFLMIEEFKKNPEKVFNLYLKNTRHVNNWDLVDVSSYKIIGAYLFDKKRDILYKLVRSNNIWEKRIAIISTFYFIKNNDFKDTFKISSILLQDNHYLIQKAVGWMLREIGKKNKEILKNFLKKNYQKISKITLCYATEKFSLREKNALANY